MRTDEVVVKNGQNLEAWQNISLGEYRARSVVRVTVKEILEGSVRLLIEQDVTEFDNERH